MTRRQKEARRAREHAIAASLRPRPVAQPSWWRRLREHQRTRTTRQLFLGVAVVLLVCTPLVWVSAGYIARPLVLDARGVTVLAEAEHRRYGRGSDTLDVRTIEPPYFSATLHHWPRDLQPGERFDLTYDPQRPSRMLAEGTPWIDAGSLAFGVFAAVLLPISVVLVPVGAELTGRARAFVAAGRLLRRADGSPRRPSVALWRGTWWALRHALPRGHAAAARHLRETAATQPAPLAVTVFVLLPVLAVAASGTFVAVSAAQAAALYDRGAATTALVVDTNLRSDWAGYVDVTFQARSGTGATRASLTQTTIRHLVAPHFELDRVEIVYDPADPDNLIEAGALPWGWDEWAATAVLVASGAFATAGIPAAVTRVRRGPHRPGPTDADA
ncbi:hypothetical protein ACFQHV_01710 [Promicromonospora thailandica]|uniref:DUF3592 domain-containing protein n=1 Tax=Promicromonospora thailandica TaxID=765201 RepID=A0A9X2GBI0_9MICO|nr:hypothetical protein [Promicromonospora thailandica]MCP2265431.1 hypothetical protein [Promicromonospora thailandica]BFF16975.1 hypothetical protein GCM10025730_04960 [Promicromonospora thailandica]